MSRQRQEMNLSRGSPDQWRSGPRASCGRPSRGQHAGDSPADGPAAVSCSEGPPRDVTGRSQWSRPAKQRQVDTEIISNTSQGHPKKVQGLPLQECSLQAAAGRPGCPESVRPHGAGGGPAPVQALEGASSRSSRLSTLSVHVRLGKALTAHRKAGSLAPHYFSGSPRNVHSLEEEGGRGMEKLPCVFLTCNKLFIGHLPKDQRTEF